MIIKKKQKATPHTFWWQSLFSLISQGILSDARATLQSMEDQFKEFVQLTIIRALLLLSGFIGYLFILIGVSRLLDTYFHFAGTGNLFVGSFILLMSFIAFALVGNQKKR